MSARSTAVKVTQKLGLFATMRAAADHVVPSIRAEAYLWRAFYGGFVRAGDLVFDVGANFGARTRDLRRLGARVVAVEMNSACADYLRHRFRDVQVVEAAAGARSGRQIAYISDHNSLAGSLSVSFIDATTKTGRFPQGMWSSQREVAVTTLDELIKEYGTPKYVKIDTEGFDADVLDGLSTPIEFVSFEHLRELPQVFERCVSRLAGLGSYEFRPLAHDEPRPLGPWMGADALIDSIREREDSFGDVLARRIKPSVT